jgi:hypothetical protein
LGKTERFFSSDPDPRLPRDELSHRITRAVRDDSGLSLADVKKAVNAPKPQEAEIIDVASELVAKGQVFRYAKGKTERFFAADPIATLDRFVPNLLGNQAPLDEKAIATACAKEHPGHEALLAEWIKNAAARRLVFELPPLVPKGKKRYDTKPDLRTLLIKTLEALKADLKRVDAARIPRETVGSFLRGELGLRDGEIVRAALRQVASENPPGELLLARHVRDRAPIEKARFDAAALELFRDRLIILQHHDHPKALSEAERSTLIFDGHDTYFLGMALPRET